MTTEQILTNEVMTDYHAFLAYVLPVVFLTGLFQDSRSLKSWRTGSDAGRSRPPSLFSALSFGLPPVGEAMLTALHLENSNRVSYHNTPNASMTDTSLYLLSAVRADITHRLLENYKFTFHRKSVALGRPADAVDVDGLVGSRSKSEVSSLCVDGVAALALEPLAAPLLLLAIGVLGVVSPPLDRTEELRRLRWLGVADFGVRIGDGE